MQLSDINIWLSRGGTYQQGVELYRTFGSNAYFKNTLFNRTESTFIKEKLRTELVNILNTYTPVENTPQLTGSSHLSQLPVKSAPPVQPSRQPITIEGFFKLPQQLQEARLQITSLFNEAMKARRTIRRELNLPSKGEITLQEAFHIMGQTDNRGKGVPFKMAWVTYNKQTAKGGDLLHLDCVFKYRNTTGSRYKDAAPVNTPRKTNHHIHGTFNVQIAGTVEIRKVHTWLIFQINGYDVKVG